MAAVHCGQRRAATGMLMVHSGQSRSVAAVSRSNSFSARLTGTTTTKYTTVAEIRNDRTSVRSGTTGHGLGEQPARPARALPGHGGSGRPLNPATPAPRWPQASPGA